MTKPLASILSICGLLPAPAALGQVAVTPDAQVPAPTAPAEAAPVQTVVAPPAKPTEQEAEMAAKLEALAKKVAALEATSQANQAATASTSRLKFSGYAQGRYEWHQDAHNGATFDTSSPGTGVATATNQNRFMVRHGFFTVHYAGSNADYLFQVDANSKDGLVLKDVCASLVDTWTPLQLKLSVGQFRYPFGHEILQAHSDREMPERAAILKFFFDGWRDRGVRLQGGYGVVNFSIALVNGTIFDGKKNLAGGKDPGAPYPFGGNDPNEFKDWVGRLGVDLGHLAGGLSGYFGKGLYIKPPFTNPADPSQNTPEIPDSRYKYRFGADVQAYLAVPGVGRLALKGEVVYGRDKARSYHGYAANPCKSSATWGFILTAVQNISGKFGVVARLDEKDTLAGSIAEGCQEKADARTDRVLTIGGGALYDALPNLRATVTYEHPTEQTGKKMDNDFAMAQLQTRF